jgi:hypothetical protein
LAEPPTVTLHESEGTYFLMENADYLLDKEKTANLEYAKKEEAKFQPIGKYFTIINRKYGSLASKFKIKNGEDKKTRMDRGSIIHFFRGKISFSTRLVVAN